MSKAQAESERHYLLLSLYGEEFKRQISEAFRSQMAAEGVTFRDPRAEEILDALPGFYEWLDQRAEPQQAKRL